MHDADQPGLTGDLFVDRFYGVARKGGCQAAQAPAKYLIQCTLPQRALDLTAALHRARADRHARAEIADLVHRGYIVRTRPDVDTVEARNNQTARPPGGPHSADVEYPDGGG